MSAVRYTAIEKNEKYFSTIRNLRSGNFRRNLPFLILSDKLPEGQVYREFPDGHIELQQVFAAGKAFEYKVLRILPAPEADKVRRAYGLH